MYDEGKRAAEAYCYSFWKKYTIPIRIARIFNTFGPRIDVKNPNSYSRSLARFIWKAINNENIEIWRDGNQTRSFCYITDQIESLFKLILTPNIDGEIVNIGSKEEISILNLAKLIVNLTNSKSKFEFTTGPEFMEDDPRRRCPDLTKAKTLIGFRPKISLEEGLKRTIQWFRSPKLDG
jgi:nucleoside-diphosphate-sugar epimerase